MADKFKPIKDLINKVRDAAEKIAPICANCGRGTLSGKDTTLECSFCKHPKK